MFTGSLDLSVSKWATEKLSYIHEYTFVYSQLKPKNIAHCHLQHKFESGLSVEKHAPTAPSGLWSSTFLLGT